MSVNNNIRFRSGVEGILPDQLRADQPSMAPPNRQVKIEGGRVMRNLDLIFLIPQTSDLMIEFIRPSVNTNVTVPAMFRRYLVSLRRKLKRQKANTRNVRRRQSVGGALDVLDDLQENMDLFMVCAASLQKA